jgi:hypothetical protein
MPVFDAPSISWTSMAVPAKTSRHAAQSAQGAAVGPFSQLRALARIRAKVVLPTPRVPENR